MSKILIVFAQFAEAEALLRQTRAQAIAGETASIWQEGTLPCRYVFDKGWIVLSGVGLHHAQMSVAKYAPLCDEVWNLGLAGTLTDKLRVGELIDIETIGKYIPCDEVFLDLECLKTILPNLFLEQQGGSLISSDFPIHHIGLREEIGKKWDLVDMEGYGVAFAASALGKKCRMWKIVSDFASPGGRELIRKHKRELSEQMAHKVMEYL